MKKALDNIDTDLHESSNKKELIIPVIEEFLTVKKEIIETGKITISKKVKNNIARIDLPLVSESYNIERIAVQSDLLETRPSFTEKDGNMIIPVVREVPVTVIKYQVIEEIHVTLKQTTVPHQQEIELRKDIIEIKRTKN